MESKISKDWQNRVKSVEELHFDSKEWISELDFISDDIRFLEHLLCSKYIECLSVGLYEKIEVFVYKLSEQKKVGETLKSIINEQEAILFDLIENDSVSSNVNFLENHKKLALEMNHYVKKYKRLKKHIFESVENVMRTIDQKKLI